MVGFLDNGKKLKTLAIFGDASNLNIKTQIYGETVRTATSPMKRFLVLMRAELDSTSGTYKATFGQPLEDTANIINQMSTWVGDVEKVSSGSGSSSTSSTSSSRKSDYNSLSIGSWLTVGTSDVSAHSITLNGLDGSINIAGKGIIISGSASYPQTSGVIQTTGNIKTDSYLTAKKNEICRLIGTNGSIDADNIVHFGTQTDATAFGFANYSTSTGFVTLKAAGVYSISWQAYVMSVTPVTAGLTSNVNTTALSIDSGSYSLHGTHSAIFFPANTSIGLRLSTNNAYDWDLHRTYIEIHLLSGCEPSVSGGSSGGAVGGIYVPPSGSSGGIVNPGTKVHVDGKILKGPDDSDLHLVGLNDSWSLCNILQANGGTLDPNDGGAECPVIAGYSIDTSSEESIATFYFRYAKALQAYSPDGTHYFNFVRIGAHDEAGTDRFWTQYVNNKTHFDRVITGMAKGFESAGMYFQVQCSGFASTIYANRVMSKTQSMYGYQNSSGSLNDNILVKDSTSFNNFCEMVAHVCNTVADFPHLVAVELYNEPDNWGQKDIFWAVKYTDDWSHNGVQMTRQKELYQGAATKIKELRNKSCLLTNGPTPFVTNASGNRMFSECYGTFGNNAQSHPASVVPIINTGMDIDGVHIYHFDPHFCDSGYPTATGNCDGTICGWKNLTKAIIDACTKPVINNEWGRYCDSASNNQSWVSKQATDMENSGMSHVVIMAPSKPTVNQNLTLPLGWQNIASAQTIEYDYIISRDGSTYYAKTSGGATTYSGSSASTVINNAIGSGGTASTKKRVQISPNTEIVLTVGTSSIVMQNYSVLKVESGVTLKAASGIWTPLVACSENTHDFEIDGGEWICTNPAESSQCSPMVFESPNNSVVKNCKVRDCMWHNIVIRNATYFTLDNVESYHSWPVDPANIHATGWAGVMFEANASHCVVQNCHLHDNGTGGCYFFTNEEETTPLEGHVDYNIMRNNLVERCATSGLSISQRSPHASSTGNNNLIEYNQLVDCGIDTDHPFINFGWDTTTVCSGNIARYNTLVDNGIVGPTGTGADSGISIAGTNNEAYNNDIKGCTNSIAVIGSGHSVHNNYIHDAPNDTGIIIGGTYCSITNNQFHNMDVTINDLGSNNTISGNTVI